MPSCVFYHISHQKGQGGANLTLYGLYTGKPVMVAIRCQIGRLYFKIFNDFWAVDKSVLTLYLLGYFLTLFLSLQG